MDTLNICLSNTDVPSRMKPLDNILVRMYYVIRYLDYCLTI
jgi:hypothetical protein